MNLPCFDTMCHLQRSSVQTTVRPSGSVTSNLFGIRTCRQTILIKQAARVQQPQRVERALQRREVFQRALKLGYFQVARRAAKVLRQGGNLAAEDLDLLPRGDDHDLLDRGVGADALEDNDRRVAAAPPVDLEGVGNRAQVGNAGAPHRIDATAGRNRYLLIDLEAQSIAQLEK